MDTFGTPFPGSRRMGVGQEGSIPFPALTPWAAPQRQLPLFTPLPSSGPSRTHHCGSAIRTPVAPSRLGIAEGGSPGSNMMRSSERARISPTVSVHPPVVRSTPTGGTPGVSLASPPGLGEASGSPLWPSVAKRADSFGASRLKRPSVQGERRLEQQSPGLASTGYQASQGLMTEGDATAPTDSWQQPVTASAPQGRLGEGQGDSHAAARGLASGSGGQGLSGPGRREQLLQSRLHFQRTVPQEGQADEQVLPGSQPPARQRRPAEEIGSNVNEGQGTAGGSSLPSLGGRATHSEALPSESGRGPPPHGVSGGDAFEDWEQAGSGQPPPPTEVYGAWHTAGTETRGAAPKPKDPNLLRAMQALRIEPESAEPSTSHAASSAAGQITGPRIIPVSSSRIRGAGHLRISAAPTLSRAGSLGQAGASSSTADGAPAVPEGEVVASSRGALTRAPGKSAAGKQGSATSPPSSEGSDGSFVLVSPPKRESGEGAEAAEGKTAIAAAAEDTRAAHLVDTGTVSEARGSDLTDVKQELSLLGFIPLPHVPQPAVSDWQRPPLEGFNPEDCLARLRNLQHDATGLLPVLDREAPAKTTEPLPHDTPGPHARGKPSLDTDNAYDELDSGPPSPMDYVRGIPTPAPTRATPVAPPADRTGSSKVALMAERLARLRTLQQEGVQLTATLVPSN